MASMTRLGADQPSENELLSRQNTARNAAKLHAGLGLEDTDMHEEEGRG